MKKILESLKRYKTAFDNRNDRFLSWTEDGISDFVMKNLEEIQNKIMEDNDFFKSNLYVEERFASMNSNNRVLYNKPMRSIILKSGNIIISRFEGENRSFSSIAEKGFEIHFNPMLNGKIHVFAYGHTHQDLNAEVKSIEIIDDPKTLSREKIESLVFEAIESFIKTSYLFVDEQEHKNKT